MAKGSPSFPGTEGGCLCGGIRYQIDEPLPPALHCHCTMCRRSSGGIVVTWITVARPAFRIVRGEPRVYRSSALAERAFCPTCGAQLTFRHDSAPDTLDVTVATLDQPDRVPADRHIFTANRIAWLRLDDHLPAFPGEPPSP